MNAMFSARQGGSGPARGPASARLKSTGGGFSLGSRGRPCCGARVSMSVNGRIAAAQARLGIGAGLLALLAGCAAADRDAPPAPAPRVHMPAPRPAPLPPAPPAAPATWLDAPLSTGDWTYKVEDSGSAAVFGGSALVIRCDPGRREVALILEGATGPLTVETTYGRTSFAGPLAASDPRLDQIAFSRGRFGVEAAGAPRLVVPAWAEPARVVEDCRG